MSYPFNKLSFGKQGEFVTSVIEIPKSSMLKVEWRRDKELFALDRVEPAIFAKPTNYGFIPQTLDEDGDELDILVVTAEPLPMGLVIEQTKVIGVINFVDDGENDHKIIAVPADDRHYGPINNFEELGDQWRRQLEHHFSHYKDLKSGGTVVKAFESPEVAWKIIADCVERWNSK